MIKKILLSVGVFLLCVSVALPMIVTLAFLPSQYSRTFFGELDEKYERLRDVDGPRLVIVGGSSVAFGYDSALLEELLGMPVVNFGLYADLGTKIMLDLSARQLRRGDVVLLAPELDAQTLSLFFNGASALKALDDRPSMLFSIDGGDFESVWGGVWQHTADKWKYLKEGAPDPAGIYNSASFNDYGDIKAGLRPENTMTGGYDSQKTVDLSPSIYSEDFVAYLNDYIKAARKKGADVYYTFCPVNAPSLDLSSVPQGEADPLAWLSARLLAFLDERLDCPVVGSPADFVMREALFYDSNFHLNDTGVPLHT
ncbi:MAG: hypothetical protein J6125_00790, partial [Clostridia bacterium]|nr:hypothetical protein [Clostridia bacterium]